MRKEEQKEKAYLQTEDRVMKTAAVYFGQELLKTLGIEGEIRLAGPTEQVQLDIRAMSEDFNFILEDGSWVHLEFESDCVLEKDLVRFRAYDAFLELSYGIRVQTVVVCTAETRIESSKLVRPNGYYEVKIICLRQEDGDEKIKEVLRKQEKGQILTQEDIAPLLLTPVMGGRSSTYERICQVMELVHGKNTELEKETVRRMEAILYAWAVKLLDHETLEKVKEGLRMTLLGQMLVEDGRKEGRKEGVSCGEYLKLIRLAARKMKRGQSKMEIAEDLLESPETIEKICRAVREHPDYDEKKLYFVLTGEKLD